MIIVSQDKKRIINFKNITDINIEFIHSDYELRASFIGECESFNIGNYEEEERAKEVLKEITRQYENSMEKLGRTTISLISFQDEFVYRMPED